MASHISCIARKKEIGQSLIRPVSYLTLKTTAEHIQSTGETEGKESTHDVSSLRQYFIDLTKSTGIKIRKMNP